MQCVQAFFLVSVEGKVGKSDSVTTEYCLDIATMTGSDVYYYVTHRKAFLMDGACQGAAHWLTTAAQSWLEAISYISRAFLVVLTLLESLS